jgi:peroxiredoxin Q/BCP
MRILATTSLLLLALCAAAGAADTLPPKVGDAAPAIRLQDQSGTWQTLEQYKGQWVVLYFYPKDDTPGCTTQVCAFRDDITQLKAQGAQVLGVSVDDVASHAEFAAKHQVPFPLLADTSKTVAESYGVLTSKLGFKYARRDTFLIDPSGKIAKHYQDVDPKQNVSQVLADLGTLKAATR